VSRHEVPTFQCPVDIPIQILGGKWKLVLLFYLLQEPRRNGELTRLVPNITQKVLTQQLRELERASIITRTVYDETPPRVVYDVVSTERDRLDALIQGLCDWGMYWSAKTGAHVIALDHR